MTACCPAVVRQISQRDGSNVILVLRLMSQWMDAAFGYSIRRGPSEPSLLASYRHQATEIKNSLNQLAQTCDECEKVIEQIEVKVDGLEYVQDTVTRYRDHAEATQID
ncbi:MAG: hypothetical protein AAF550_02455, partial [Myxococcota bacterium]